ncbi:MAG: hypothetical protein PHC90_05870 [Syntrophorhabdaceae bacterium]|nr:hypothetical protein [Syntrophorhabdaceae bacterium]
MSIVEPGGDPQRHVIISTASGATTIGALRTRARSLLFLPLRAIAPGLTPFVPAQDGGQAFHLCSHMPLCYRRFLVHDTPLLLPLHARDFD